MADTWQAVGGPANGPRAGPYGARDRQAAPGFAARLLEFCDELRREGMAVGTSELSDAFAALEQISWSTQTEFRGALSTTLAKSQTDQRIFDQVFDRFFFRAPEQAASDRDQREQTVGEAERIDQKELRERVQRALQEGTDGELRDLARLAIAAFANQGEASGVVGVDVQRIRRGLGLQASSHVDSTDGSANKLKSFERHLRRELERGLIERTGALPPARPLQEFDRALPGSPLQDLAEVHRVVSQLKRRLATQSHQLKGRQRSAVVDVRHTMRSSLETGGVPLKLRYRPRRPRRPELYVLCDVSTSVTSASVFFLSVLHALHDTFRKLRSFVFVERVSEVTEMFEGNRSFRQISEAITTHAGVSDVSGYTDYGRVWVELLEQIADDLDPRSTLIVLGDARTNGRRPCADAFAELSRRAGRTFWINPEPKLYWNYGDSVMDAYQPYCDGVFECWTSRQLEVFVNAVARFQTR